MESYLPSNSPDKAPQGFYPLHVARYCSQVCQSWRQTMVGSSQVWADLIDLDQIKHQDNDHWMDLVMQRTGRALLSVVGHRGVGSHRASQRFFTFLLTEEWPRVGEFNVNVSLSKFPTTLWHSFWKTSSPHLEEFKWHSWNDPQQYLTPTPSLPIMRRHYESSPAPISDLIIELHGYHNCAASL